MRNLGFFLSLCLLAAAAPDEASQIAAAEEQPVEIAAPELDAAPEFEVGATSRPKCSDPRLTQKIVEKIEAYQSEHPAAMLIDRRRDILLRRNLSRFGEVKVEGFTAKQDFNVANAIIMMPTCGSAAVSDRAKPPMFTFWFIRSARGMLPTSSTSCPKVRATASCPLSTISRFFQKAKYYVDSLKQKS